MYTKLIRFIFGFQIICATLFLAEFIGGLSGLINISWEWHEIIEIGTVLGLISGVVVSFEVQRRLLRRNQRVEDQLSLARGEFGLLLEARFEQWNLTVAEQHVTMMAIKGFSISEIAEIRGTSGGTIKAQNAAIYRKAGVAGRNQLLVSFVEDLVDQSAEVAKPTA